MTTCVNYRVVFNDGSNVLSATQKQGIECTLFQAYAQTFLPEFQLEDHVVLTTLAEFAQLADLTSELYPLHVEKETIMATKNSYYSLASAKTNQVAVGLFMSLSREQLLQTPDKKLEKSNYDRYCQLYNTGQALFGAELNQIESITFDIDK